MPVLPAWPRAFLIVALAASLLAGGPAAGQTTPPPALPPEVLAALVRGKLPSDAITMLVVDVDGKAPPRLSHRPAQPVNPASIAKLATTFAALDLLGPAFTWRTPVHLDGPVVQGTLHGNLVLQGQGDPKLVAERLWLLMRRVQALGVRHIAGDIVLDHSAFELASTDPAAFDGEPLRPYNAAPDALLLNYRSLVLTFNPLQGAAQVSMEPPLDGVQVPASVPLLPGDCGDWRARLQADFSDPAQLRLAGGYPVACGERSWSLAYADPRSYAARAVAGMWQAAGGTLGGQVRDGTRPLGLAPAFELVSPTLVEVVRDVNKFSNNVMAQQLFLTLSQQFKGVGSLDGSRELMRTWWRERVGGEPPAFDNGSGLSREERVSAAQLARLLQVAWLSPTMPELMASLPIAGTDGTLRRNRGRSAGLAHLKSGSLRDVTGVAGYVHAASGRRYVLVAIANHANAAAMRPVIDALLDWTVKDL